MSKKQTPKSLAVWAPCRLRDCKNRPPPFPSRMSYKETVFYIFLSMLYTALLFIRAPFLCIISFHCYVFRLLVVLVKLSVLTIDWLEILPAQRDTFHTIVVRYRLFALIVLLNTKQTNKRFGCMNLVSACNLLWWSVLP